MTEGNGGFNTPLKSNQNPRYDYGVKETLHIYTRVSSKKQTEGESLKVQKELGIQKSKELGMSYKIWNETHASSNHETFHNRPVMRDLLFAVESGEVKHIYAYDDDRLSRNDETQFQLKTAFRKNEVKLYTNKSTTNFDDPTDRLIKSVFDAFASYENQMRAIRSRLGKLEKVKKGEWYGGQTPYGFEVKDKKLVPHKVESRWVKRIFESYAKGKTVIEIKKDLDKNGVIARRGGFFSTGSIHKLLTVTHHKGFYLYEDDKFNEEVTIECPPIVSEVLWDKVKKRREQDSRTERKGGLETHFYLLTGMLYCGHCGSRMSGRTSPKKNEYLYYCPKKQRDWKKGTQKDDQKWVRGKTKEWGCAMTKSLSIPLTDAYIWLSVKDIVKDSSLLKEIFKKEVLEKLSSNKTAENIKKETAKKSRLEKELENTINTLADAETDYLLSKSTDETDKSERIFNRISSNLNKKIRETQKNIEQTETNLEELKTERRWVDWVSKYGEEVEMKTDASPEEKKKYLQGLVDRISVRLDLETKGHAVEIQFNIGLVDDQVVYKNANKKSAGYEVKEGKKKVKGVIPPTPRGRYASTQYPMSNHSTVTDLARFRG